MKLRWLTYKTEGLYRTVAWARKLQFRESAKYYGGELDTDWQDVLLLRIDG